MTIRVKTIWPYAPRGHKGYCCDSCIEDSNEGYGDLHPLCCCLDKRPFEVAERQWEAWLSGMHGEDAETKWLAATRQ